jgi:hypothetical protein
MSSRLAMAAIVLVVAGVAVVLVLRRHRRMHAESRQLEMKRAMEQDAMHRASAKHKFMNSNRSRGESGEQDPLKDLFGLEVPTDFRPAKKKSNSGQIE